MRKKIVLFCKSLSNSGGIERMTANLANGLCGKYDVYVVTCEAKDSIFYSIDKSVSVISLSSSFVDRIRSAYRFRRLIKRISPDIIINVAVAMGQISIPALLFMSNKPIIIAWEHFSIYAGSRMGYLFRLFSAACCSRTVVLTNRDRRDYPKFLRRKVFTIYNFTDFDSPNIIRKDCHIVLAVGRLSYEKGYDKLLMIWRKVVEKCQNWKLIIVGDGPYKTSLIKMVEDLDLSASVNLISATRNIVSYYDNASIFVMTSRHEGLPMVLIEAKMRGLPCVCYNFPNGPDEIIRDRKDGFLVELDNEKKFVKILIELMANREMQIEFGHKAIHDAKLRFGSSAILDLWFSFLDEINS